MADPAGGTEHLIVERRGSVVVLQITCIDDYAAMLFADQIAEQALRGGVTISLATSVPKEAQIG